jgi:tRNA pseudouridine32 synthase/23S rRNA pseudouridine746 synthase
MHALGHAIVGDEFYASPEAMAFADRLELYATEMTFYHSATQELQAMFVPCDFYPEAKPCNNFSSITHYRIIKPCLHPN